MITFQPKTQHFAITLRSNRKWLGRWLLQSSAIFNFGSVLTLKWYLDCVPFANSIFIGHVVGGHKISKINSQHETPSKPGRWTWCENKFKTESRSSSLSSCSSSHFGLIFIFLTSQAVMERLQFRLRNNCFIIIKFWFVIDECVKWWKWDCVVTDDTTETLLLLNQR